MLFCRFLIAAAGVALLVSTPGPLLARQTSAETRPLPTAEQVVERFVAAQGGHDVIFRHHSMTVHGRIEVVPKQLSFEQVGYYKDGKVYQETKDADGGIDRTGFDGKIAWQIDAKGTPQVAPDNILESIRRDADMHYFGHILDYFQSMTVVDVAQFGGHTCYHLKGANKWGIQNEQFYDTTSGLLVGYQFDSTWRGGPGLEYEVFSDYKRFDGWLMPTSDVQSNAKSSTSTITTSNFERWSI